MSMSNERTWQFSQQLEVLLLMAASKQLFLSACCLGS